MTRNHVCVCGHPKVGNRDGRRGQGHAGGVGKCLACLLCEDNQATGGHLPERCGCTEFEPAERVTYGHALMHGGVPCRCGEHYKASHPLGGGCRARDALGQPCRCPGYDPDPRYIITEGG